METSELITQKARELFLRDGIRSVTIDKIAAQLGMSKKTIYKYFENKDALVEIFIEKHLEENMAGYKRLVRAENDPVTGLFLTLIYAQRLYMKLNPFIIRDLERNHFKAYQLLDDYKEKYIFNKIKNCVESGVNQHFFEDTVNVSVMARFFIQSLDTLSDSSIYSELTSDSNVFSENILGYIISGMATPAGMVIIDHYKVQHRYTTLTFDSNKPFWDD